MTNNPRELCRQASALLVRAELSDARMNIRAFGTLIEEAANGGGDPDPVMYAIDVAAMRLLENFREIEAAMDQVLDYCRRGTGTHDIPEQDDPEK